MTSTLQKQDNYLHLFDEARMAGIILAPLDDSLAEMERVRPQHGRPVVLVNDTGTEHRSVAAWSSMNSTGESRHATSD